MKVSTAHAIGDEYTFRFGVVPPHRRPLDHTTASFSIQRRQRRERRPVFTHPAGACHNVKCARNAHNAIGHNHSTSAPPIYFRSASPLSVTPLTSPLNSRPCMNHSLDGHLSADKTQAPSRNTISYGIHFRFRVLSSHLLPMSNESLSWHDVSGMQGKSSTLTGR